MSSKNKTVETSESVADFIHAFVEHEQKKAESFQLVSLMEQWSGYAARMWGPSIVGFGAYHYKYASGREGDAPLLGFSPRKAAFSLYIYSPTQEIDEWLEKLGKYKMGKACIYVKSLSDIDLIVLEKICRASMAYTLQNLDTRSPEV